MSRDSNPGPEGPDALRDLWTTPAEEEPVLTFDPAALRQEARSLDRSLRRRNALELVVGAGLLLVFGASFLRRLAEPDPAMAAAIGIMWVGVVGVMVGIWRRGRAPRADRGDDTLGFLAAHRAELAWQVDLLRDVPRWYVGPLVPGFVAVYAVRAWQRLHGLPLEEALARSGPVVGGLVFTGVVIAGVIWINRLGARRLQARLEALPELGGDATSEE